MTIASELSKVSYSGNGSTTRFAIPFAFIAAGDLTVILRGADESETTQTISTHYTLKTEEVGGTCVMLTAPAEGESLVIKRDPAILQETVYEEGVPLSAKAREKALDLVTMICQANRERVDRAVKFSPTSQASEATMPEPEAGHAIVWNAAGTDLENGPTTTLIETAQASSETAQASAATAQAAQAAAETAQAAAEAARDEAQAIVDVQASAVGYDNTTSGLASDTVQEAIDELAFDTSGLAGISRQMSLGFFQLMANQAMTSMDVANRVLHTFEDSGGIDAANSSNYAHDADEDMVTPTTPSGTEAVDFSDEADFVQEDVSGSVTTLTVDTADASGHFDADAGTKLVEGCRVLLSDDSEVIIMAIANTGTGTDEVEFSGTLAAGAHTVAGIHGMVIEDGKVSLNEYDTGVSATSCLAGGTITLENNENTTTDPAVIVDGSTSTYFMNNGSGTTVAFDILYDLGAGNEVVPVKWGILPYDSRVDFAILYGSNDGVTYTQLDQITGFGAALMEQEFTNTAAYRYLKTSINNAADSRDAGVSEWHVYGSGVGCPTDTLFSVRTGDLNNTATWSGVTGLVATQVESGQTIRYAFSFDGGATWQAWDQTDWSTVSYPCDDVAAWMEWADIDALAESDFPTLTGPMRVAVALMTNSASANPEVSNVTLTGDAQPQAMVLQLEALSTTDVPDSATVLAVVKEIDTLTMNTDLVAEVSRDGGVSWDSVTIAKVADFLTDKVVVEGSAPFTHADGGSNEALVRWTTAAGVDMEMHYASLGVEV